MGDCKDPERCHEHHLCKLAKREDLETIRKLVKDPAHICAKCGRVAREARSLCDPARL